VAEPVDARDLKSLGLCPCGFDPRRPHQLSRSVLTHCRAPSASAHQPCAPNPHSAWRGDRCSRRFPRPVGSGHASGRRGGPRANGPAAASHRTAEIGRQRQHRQFDGRRRRQSVRRRGQRRQRHRRRSGRRRIRRQRRFQQRFRRRLGWRLGRRRLAVTLPLSPRSALPGAGLSTLEGALAGRETAGTSPPGPAGGPMAPGDAEHSPLFHVESPHRGATHEQYHLHHRACGRRDRDLVVLRASLSGSRLAAAGGRPLAFPGSRAGPKQPVHLSPVGCGLSATVIHGRLCQYRWHKSAFSCVGGPV
jgi:hypothetical protein